MQEKTALSDFHSPDCKLGNHDAMSVERSLHERAESVVVFQVLDGWEASDPGAYERNISPACSRNQRTSTHCSNASRYKS